MAPSRNGLGLVMIAASGAVAGAGWLVVAAVRRDRARTARRAAEARHRDAENQCRGLLRDAPDAVVVVDFANRIRFVNDEFERLFGYTEDEALGQPIEMLVPERLRARHATDRAGYLAAPRRRPMGAGLDLVARRKDGREFPVEISLSPRTSDGESFVTAVVRDVTVRRELERLRQDFLALVSHDLRAPLSTISLQAEVLRRSLERRGLIDEARSAEVIQRVGRRMNGMIQDLLDSARSESGHLELAQEPVDLGPFVANVLDVALAPDERARVRIERPARPVYASIDRDRFDRVVLNLVSNALKYSPADRPVTVRVRDGDRVRLAVEDRGAGIAPDALPHLFEKYYRAPDARAQGIGLGLYIVRLLVEAHGGRVGVESAPGRGSTFTVELPRATRAEHAVPGAASTAPRRSEPGRPTDAPLERRS